MSILCKTLRRKIHTQEVCEEGRGIARGMRASPGSRRLMWPRSTSRGPHTMMTGWWWTVAQASQLAQSTTRQSVRSGQDQSNSPRLCWRRPHWAHWPEDGRVRHKRWCQRWDRVRSRQGSTATGLGGQLGGEKTGGSVLPDSGGFIIPRSALQVDPAVRKVSTKRQDGHFWLPLARRVETAVNPVMVAPKESAAEEQDVDEKMDEELSVEERSARVVRKPGEPTQEERSAHGERACRSATGVSTASRAKRQRERRADRPWCRIDHQFASEKPKMDVSSEQFVTAGPMVPHLHGDLLWKWRSRCDAVVEVACLAAFLMGQLAAWGPGSGALVPTRRRAWRRCLARTRHGWPDPWWKEQRRNRTSWSTYESSRLTKHGSAAKWRWILTSSDCHARSADSAFGVALSSERSCGRGSLPRRSSASWTGVWVEVVWAGKAGGSDEHIGLESCGARRSRAVRREPKSSRWRREVTLEFAAVLGTWVQLVALHAWCFQPSCSVWRPCTSGASCWSGSSWSGTASGGTTAARRKLNRDMANTPITASGRRIYYSARNKIERFCFWN